MVGFFRVANLATLLPAVAKGPVFFASWDDWLSQPCALPMFSFSSRRDSPHRSWVVRMLIADH
ncbi:hypothetical protein CHELA40_13678 [Chelatococcus asaccharovorans]|nr:hypothetical protein CHELA40_13678 [Chelatococcus asaccharovorans]CAH1676386.1 hypothetical protein CHELA17_61947 [Chelatococcus asaccharovorans]